MMKGNALGQRFNQLMVFSDDLFYEWYVFFIYDILMLGQGVDLRLLRNVSDFFREGLTLCWPR
jgi:hypothetical protein